METRGLHECAEAGGKKQPLSSGQRSGEVCTGPWRCGLSSNGKVSRSPGSFTVQLSTCCLVRWSLFRESPLFQRDNILFINLFSFCQCLFSPRTGASVCTFGSVNVYIICIFMMTNQQVIHPILVWPLSWIVHKIFCCSVLPKFLHLYFFILWWSNCFIWFV